MIRGFLVLLLVRGAVLAAQPTIAGCPVFPVTNIWNVAVDQLAVHPNSDNIVNSIGASAKLRLDDTMPINVVAGNAPKQAIPAGSDEDDAGLYPTPANVVVEAGSDAHALVVDKDNCLLYESWNTQIKGGVWSVGSKAKWDLRSNALRPDGWTSADAAGLPIVPGILRYDEVLSGAVNHALRFTAQTTLGFQYVWPARHYASHATDSKLPMMGQRLRLKAGVDISGFSPAMRVILNALKKYGVILADNGLAWAMQHDQDPRWDAADLVNLHNLVGSQMELVDATVFRSDPDSALAVVPVPQGVFVTDALGRKNLTPFGAGLAVVDGALTATGGAAATGAVSSVAGKRGDVALEIRDVGGLSDALAAKQPLLGYTPERPLTFDLPLARAGDTVSCAGCLGVRRPGRGAAALLKVDTTTMGSWQGVYGKHGRNILTEPAAYPSYVTATLLYGVTQTWTTASHDVRALQKTTAGERAAAGSTNAGPSILDLDFADEEPHQVAIYFLDWDTNGARSQKVTVTDPFGAVLDSRELTAFDTGKYLVWRLSGHVIVRIAATSPDSTAVWNGIFFD